MNTNTTKSAFSASAWMRSDYKQQQTATAGESGGGSLSDKRIKAKAKACVKASGAMIILSESSHGGCHGINER